MDYVKTCELDKKNKDTITNAYNKCVDDKPVAPSGSIVVVTATMALLLGLVAGHSLK